ncbi:MAG: hypothetical protein RML46_01575 [Anaerolineae bacterium]|nr:hypothetical protein [Anaerolineae bacterium]
MLVYDLEAYIGKAPSKRPDRMLVGKVRLAKAEERERWVVVLVDLRSGTGWKQALEQFEAVLPALGKGGEAGGEQHHQESRDLLPIGKGHRVFALVVGHVGKEVHKEEAGKQEKARKQRPMQVSSLGDWERVQRILWWQGKPILVVSPTARSKFKSLTDFFAYIGAVSSSEKR